MHHDMCMHACAMHATHVVDACHESLPLFYPFSPPWHCGCAPMGPWERFAWSRPHRTPPPPLGRSIFCWSRVWGAWERCLGVVGCRAACFEYFAAHTCQHRRQASVLTRCGHQVAPGCSRSLYGDSICRHRSKQTAPTRAAFRERYASNRYALFQKARTSLLTL